MSSAKKTDGKQGPSRPWRDNIEAITVSVVIIVLFKYFVLEAYKIPTGSMQPTLMGWSDPAGGGIFDRVLVDKFSFHYRDPERFEIAVFKYPLDSSKNYIKRIVGMPGEELELRDGDVFVRPDGEEDWHALQRPRRVQGAQFKDLETAGEWKLEGAFRADDGGDELVADGPGSARFPRTRAAVLDAYTDGYPEVLRKLVRHRSGNVARNEVGDLRLRAEVEADAACSAVRLEILDGPQTHVLHLPGPAAPADARARYELVRVDDTAATVEQDDLGDVRLAAGDELDVELQNLDDRVEVRLDGELVLRAVVPAVPARELERSGVRLVTEGGGASFEDVGVWRDIWYTEDQSYARWSIPEGHYLVLGDNTQDSSDGRDWKLTGYRVPGEDGELEEVRGNLYGDKNPQKVLGGPDGTLFYFRDQLGELHVFPQRGSQRLDVQQASFVPRELIRGRAVMVVWPPYARKYGISRLQWVR